MTIGVSITKPEEKQYKSKYKKVKLKDGTTRDEHRLVMENILGRKLKRSEVVHHKNGNGFDNRPENLQVMKLADHTREHFGGENSPYRGELGPASKLTDERVILARVMSMAGITYTDIGKLFDVSRTTISGCVRGVTWKHLKVCLPKKRNVRM